MKTKLLTLILASCSLCAMAGSKVVYTTDIVRSADKTADQPTAMKVSTNAIVDALALGSEADIANGLSDGSILFLAKQGSASSTYSTASYGKHGYWFTKSGIACAASNTNRRIACKYEDGAFIIVHNADKVADGDSYSFAEMFVQGEDTVQYSFNVTIGANESITSDQPEYKKTYKHRADERDAWPLLPMVRQNDGEWVQQTYIQVMAGDKISFSLADKDGNTTYRVRYLDRNGTQIRGYKADPEFVLTEDATPANSGCYQCNIMYKDAEGTTHTETGFRIYVDVQTEPLGTPFSWEGRVTQFSHDWTTDAAYNNGVFVKPEKTHTIYKKNGSPANSYSGEWWSAFWGDNLNSEVGGQEKAMEAAKNMVEKYDDDFAYIRDYMGWPPDKSARDGYKSFVYIFGSGLKNDNTSNTEKGGYQSSTYVDGANYACVWASYYPFSRFRSDADQKWSDGDYQREAMIHEGIHAIFADLNACSKSSWFHEAGNTWLQSAMNTERYNRYGTPGFLDACPLVAPFMPIECYSGWLLDGSFGGPTADGVNVYGADGQVCTWRNLLGGTQYGNSFPIILGEICGKGSIPWIWRNAKDYVLKSIGGLLGEDMMRDLIMQYRARMATFDIGGWKEGYRNIMNSNIGTIVKEEYGNGVMTKDNKNSDIMPCLKHVEPFALTPYQGLTINSDDHWLAPDTLTCPGWSACNIIPIHVDSKANSATIEFLPQNDRDMRAQLCYVTKGGKNYYSQYAHCGKIQIDLTDRPANNVVFLVVANTDYIYTGDAQRRSHYDYRVRFGEGALAVADLYTKWSLNEKTITDPNYDEDAARAEQEIALGIEDVQIDAESSASEYVPGQNGVRLVTGLCRAGQPLTVQLANGIAASDVTVSILGLSGFVADEAPLQGNSYTLPSNLTPGLYFVKFIQNGKTDTYKIIVK
ncbi:MAG: T9SS type A sorting domain-containing protein [Prevotellaceae bacterium]|nr:T9SS type A sorting domain-containing protein [Candidatus Minthosoma equi]